MSTETPAPDTIVLTHGFWVTPRSWEHWIEHYEKAGMRVIAPAYPGFEVEAEALNEDPVGHGDGGQGVRGMAHLLPAQEGWEEVPDYALSWARDHA